MIAEEAETCQSSTSLNSNKCEQESNTKTAELVDDKIYKKYSERNSLENLRIIYQKSLSQSITEYDELNSNSLSNTMSYDQNLTEKLKLLDKLGSYGDTEEDDGDDDANIEIIYI